MNTRTARSTNGKEIDLAESSRLQPILDCHTSFAMTTDKSRCWLQEINRCLPISFANPDEESYIRSLRETFELNYANEKYEFAHFAFHLLYMSFAAFTVWKIRKTRETDFRKALIGFHRDQEREILKSTSPFTLLRNIREGNVFRFLKLIGCDNIHVGGFSQFSKRRNRIAHPEGSLFINNPGTLDWHLSGILKEVDNIQTHMQPVIEELHTENIRTEEFIRENYLSLRDMESWI